MKQNNMPIAVSLLLFGLAGVNAFLPTRAISRTTMSTTTQLGISEALGRYIDEEYYRENHKEEYNMQWVHQNKAAILYHTHDGDLVLGDPHLDFQTHTEHTESPQHYVATHPQVRHSICDTQKSIMNLRPVEFMRECHGCVHRCVCEPAKDYYDTFLEKLKPKDDELAYAYTRGE